MSSTSSNSQAPSASASVAQVEGTWAGALTAGPLQLHLVFHISRGPEGLKATMDSPDQGATGIPASKVTVDGQTLTIEIAVAHGTFAGTLSSDNTTVSGAWRQGGNTLPLTLKRSADSAALAPERPQNPVPPFPYGSEDVTYPNSKAGNTIAATLTIPQGKGPFPAVLLISGSGPHDRDETLLGHKPFLVLSDFLTRHGIAVLRADKRGVGKSTGDGAKATTEDYASDAEAGVAFLRTRHEVDPRRIGVLGHSEGGIVGPIVAAAEPKEIAFVVIMAGSGVPGREIIVAQTRLIAEASGVPPAEADKNAAEEGHLLDIVLSEPNSPELAEKLHDALAADGFPEARIQPAVQALTSPWYRYFLSFDPATALRRVRCPVLALAGSKDTQVPPAENLAAIRAALEAGGNRNVQTIELPGLNHLFQTANTGAPSEYAKIEQTMAPEAMQKIADWILRQPAMKQ